MDTVPGQIPNTLKRSEIYSNIQLNIRTGTVGTFNIRKKISFWSMLIYEQLFIIKNKKCLREKSSLAEFQNFPDRISGYTFLSYSVDPEHFLTVPLMPDSVTCLCRAQLYHPENTEKYLASYKKKFLIVIINLR